MSQADVNQGRRVIARRWLWSLALWAVTFAAFHQFCPPIPRLTLNPGERIQIVGITPDGVQLVALSYRAVATATSDDGAAQRHSEYTGVYSGPLHVWDMKTGERRLIDLPGQSKGGSIVETNNSNDPARVDPDGWELKYPVTPLSKGQLYLTQTNRVGERWLVTVYLDSGITTRVRMPDADIRNSWRNTFSVTGRWLVERHPTDDSSYEERLRVIDTQTGKVMIDMIGAGGIDGLCFSDDDSVLAFIVDNESDANSEGTAQVWQLEPLKQLQAIPERSGGMSFSPDKKWLAFADYGGVWVFEVKSGQLVHHFPGEDLQLRKSLFTADGKHLIAYDYLRGGASGVPPSHCQISEIHVWNLMTKEHAEYLSRDHIDFYDPNLCLDGWSDQMTPLIVGDEHRLFDVLTGHTVFNIPHGASVESLSTSRRMIVLHRRSESRLNKLLSYLSQWNIPYFSALWQDEQRSELLVYSVPSGGMVGSLPFDQTWVTPDNFTISPNEQALVTISASAPPVLHVWDLPPHKPTIWLLSWSLLVPLCYLSWPLWRRYRVPLFSRRF